MQKTIKIQRLFQENNIERDNFTLVIRLKQKVQELNLTIKQQQDIITSFKKDVKTTKINEMQIQIQHLQDENKRLVLLVEQLKNKNKTTNTLSNKKGAINVTKIEEKRPVITELKCDNKLYEVLKENQSLKKELMGLKVSQTMLKKRKSLINDRNSMFIEKKLIEYEKICQKKLEVEAENTLMSQKIKRLEDKVNQLQKQNQELSINQHHYTFKVNKK